MTSIRRSILTSFYKLSDSIIFISSLEVAFWIKLFFIENITEHSSYTDFFYVRFSVVNFIVILGMIYIWHIIFKIFQLYRSRRMTKGNQEWKDIIKATTSGTIVFILIAYFFKISVFSPFFIAFFWFFSTIFTLLFRGMLRRFLYKVRLQGGNLRNILIVGTNQRSYDFARTIEEKKELGYRIIGYVDDNMYIPNDEVQLIGTIETFPAIISKGVIDEVIITLPIKSYYDQIQWLVRRAEEQGITIKYFSEVFHIKIARLREETFENFSIMTIASRHQGCWQYEVKRLIDIIFSFVLILLTLPLMVLVAIASKFMSPGPVLFLQRRVGMNKRIVRIIKFRTMLEGAEEKQLGLEELNEMDGPAFKIKNDPRITKLGRWLRKTSIDELPQLFNVIRGDMSLVGPRPLPVRDYNGFNEDWQRRRFSVPPGITCNWQINGRNNVTFEEWMKMDMEYIDNWSLLRDFKILLKTFSVVLKMEGS